MNNPYPLLTEAQLPFALFSLAEIYRELKELDVYIPTCDREEADMHYKKGFAEGSASGILHMMEQHPKWWDRDCNCLACQEKKSK